MLSLKVPAQNYAWGRPAAESTVAQLAAANGTAVSDTKPYAELWMGSHPSGPAYILGTETTLKSWLEQHPESLGDLVVKFFGTDLPFLFKVLSVQTALSIQSHPDKKLAERLHKEQPQNYKDDNHKPEMALALTDFEAMSSFVSFEELKANLESTPELVAVVGADKAAAFAAGGAGNKETLKDVFQSLMTADPALVAAELEKLVARLSAKADASAIEKLALRLNEQYPKDVGVFCAYFLNLVTLKAGQAIYLAANEPHAYVSGELVECMAASDNVIRAGLTPKYRDTDSLCGSLTYETGFPEVLEGTPVDEYVKIYRPPFEEFEIHLISVPAGATTTLPVNPGPMILLVHEGAGSATAASPLVASADVPSEATLSAGGVFFIPAGAEITVSATSALKIWGAATNGNFFTLHSIVDTTKPSEVAQPVAA